MKEVAIVIPIYKKEMSKAEASSLRQCYKVLGNHDIYLVCPDSLDTSSYEALLAAPIRTERFDNTYFEGINGYNKLCTDNLFYSRFANYRYILIYQLDAWVFGDELNDWCAKGYDYIGAPWFEDFKTHEEGKELAIVGNGGLSLRKTERFLYLTNPSQRLRSTKELLSLSIKGMRSFAKSILYLFGWHNTIGYYRNLHRQFPEDIYFCTCLSVFPGLKLNVPSVEQAAHFAFECSPDYMYNYIGGKLPFGCHAWERYNSTFWNQFIHLTDHETLDNND